MPTLNAIAVRDLAAHRGRSLHNAGGSIDRRSGYSFLPVPNSQRPHHYSRSVLLQSRRVDAMLLGQRRWPSVVPTQRPSYQAKRALRLTSKDASNDPNNH
jgi:hypothetical protein